MLNPISSLVVQNESRIIKPVFAVIKKLRCSKFVLTILFLFTFFPYLFCQLPCLGVTSSCISDLPNIGDPNTYKCIDAASFQGSMQNVINSGNNLLVDASQSASTVQRIVIRGQLRVDVSFSGGYTFPANSVIIFTDNSSELSVRPGKKLTIRGTTIGGCSSMWNQIDVWPTGTLILENSNIFDGITGVNAQTGSTISITGNQFKRNLVAVRIGTPNTSGAVTYASGGGVWGNSFSGSDILKDPYAGRRPELGIVVNSVGSLTIGGSAQNKFADYTNTFGASNPCFGIGIYNASVSVSNSAFQDVGRASTGASNASIYVVSGTLTLNGLGNGTADPNTILFNENGTPSPGDGIILYASSATVTNTKIAGVTNGIYNFRPNGSTPAMSLNVNTSSFIGFSRDAIIATFNPAGNIPLNLSAFQVSDCLFDDNSSVAGPTKHCIKAEGGSPSSGAGFKFINNKMYHRARPTDDFYQLHCFYLSNIDGGLGQYNNLYDEGTLFFSSPNEFIGVYMAGCKNISWSTNNFFGNSIPGFNNEFGFKVFDSPACAYSCNYMNDLLYGMQFSNICSGSRLTQNNFNNHATGGVYLNTNGTEIGQQILRGNSWNGSSPKEAYMEFDGYNPLSASDQNQVIKSLFRINTNNQSSSLWANPRIVESGGNDPNWFKGPLTPGPYLVSACPLPAFPIKGDLDEMEKQMLVGNHSPYHGFAANTSEAEFHLFDKLHTDPDLRPQGSDENTWYQTKYNTNLGKFVRVYRSMINLTGPSPTGTATQLLSDLNAITTSVPYEQNLKSVLQIALTQATSPSGSVADGETTILQSIANQCRYQGGLGVAMARSMLKMPMVLDGDCVFAFQEPGSDDRGVIVETALKAELYPNPAKDELNIGLNMPLVKGRVTLSNLAGQLLRQWPIDGDRAALPLNGLQNGIYLVEVLDASGQVFRSKIAVFN